LSDIFDLNLHLSSSPSLEGKKKSFSGSLGHRKESIFNQQISKFYSVYLKENEIYIYKRKGQKIKYFNLLANIFPEVKKFIII